MSYTEEEESRFWGKVAQRDSGCWEWTAANNKKKAPYGLLTLRNVGRRAHRVAYEIENGTIPQGGHVLHSCDNTLCCNPSHLFLGDHNDNMQDKVDKGRQARNRGEAHPSRKLTKEDVFEVIRLCEEEGLSQEVVGARFGIRQTSVSNIINGKTWSHITERG